MKTLCRFIIFSFLFLLKNISIAQNAENVILFTTDGLRWQEVFGGIDTLIASNQQFTSDKNGLMKKYYDTDINLRRQKLMPFFWSKIAIDGTVLGNRWKGNFMDVENNYWFEINLQKPCKVLFYYNVDWSKGRPVVKKKDKAIHDCPCHYEEALMILLGVYGRVLDKQKQRL